MSDISGIAYRPLSETEKREFQIILATGNLTVETIARKADMDWSKADIYRCVAREQLTRHQHCSEREIVVCNSISQAERKSIQAIEQIKLRLLEGHINQLKNLAYKRLPTARRYAVEQDDEIMQDLLSEAALAFSHAVYRFNRYDIVFITFLTTVVKNWLRDYCGKLAPVKISQDMRDLLLLYQATKIEQCKSGRKISHEEIVQIIMANELRDRGVAVNARNIEEVLEKQRERFYALQQLLRRTLRLYDRRKNIAESYIILQVAATQETEVALRELLEKLTPLQKQIVEHKLQGGSLKALTASLKETGLSVKEVGVAYEKIKQVLGPALAGLR